MYMMALNYKQEIETKRHGERGRGYGTTQGRYIIADTISGREIVTLCRRISEAPGCIERFRVPQCHAPLRLWYGREEDVCTIIDGRRRRGG